MKEGNNFATTKHSTHVSSKMVLRFLQHVLYIHFYIICGAEFFSFTGMKVYEWFFFSLLNRHSGIWEEKLEVEMMCFCLRASIFGAPQNFHYFRPAFRREIRIGASFTLWPWQWYGLSNSQASANPHLLISPRLLLTPRARLFAHRLTDDAQSPEMLVI